MVMWYAIESRELFAGNIGCLHCITVRFAGLVGTGREATLFTRRLRTHSQIYSSDCWLVSASATTFYEWFALANKNSHSILIWPTEILINKMYAPIISNSTGPGHYDIYAENSIHVISEIKQKILKLHVYTNHYANHSISHTSCSGKQPILH